MLKLALPTWGKEESRAIQKVLKSGNLTMGQNVTKFERMYAEYIGTKYCVACNSGSSANLLMVAAMSLRQGVGEIIVPAVSWSTSYAPFQQYGWKLKFVDIDRDTLNYDLKALDKAYTGNELVLAVNLLGNPNDYMRFPTMDILEDNCESMGAEYDAYAEAEEGVYKASIKTGKLGVMASHSTFFSHHMQTMEGGLITTDDEYFHEMLLCLRSHGWTRHLPENNCLEAKVSSYEFIYPGYNLRPTEIMGAVGVEQIKKLPHFINQRRENAEGFKEVAKRRGWQIQTETGRSSWFAFAICSEEIEELKKELNEKEIEHRPIVAGNFTKSPSIKYYDYTIHGELTNADYIAKYGLYIGNNHLPIDWSIL